MKQVLSLIAIILLSAAAALAQTAPESKRDVSFRARSKKVVASADRRVVRIGPSTTYLKNGLTTSEVLRLVGEPEQVSERTEGDRKVSTYVFPRGEGRVLVAEFANDMLIGSRTETRVASVHTEVLSN